MTKLENPDLTPGERLFNEWSGDSYEWKALHYIKHVRWEKLAKTHAKTIAAAKEFPRMVEALESAKKWIGSSDRCPNLKSQIDFALARAAVIVKE